MWNNTLSYECFAVLCQLVSSATVLPNESSLDMDSSWGGRERLRKKHQQKRQWWPIGAAWAGLCPAQEATICFPGGEVEQTVPPSHQLLYKLIAAAPIIHNYASTCTSYNLSTQVFWVSISVCAAVVTGVDCPVRRNVGHNWICLQWCRSACQAGVGQHIQGERAWRCLSCDTTLRGHRQ